MNKSELNIDGLKKMKIKPLFKILVVFILCSMSACFCVLEYISDEKSECLSNGYCPEGFRFKGCDWEGECVVTKETCLPRGKWIEKKRFCKFD